MNNDLDFVEKYIFPIVYIAAIVVMILDSFFWRP
jgi:hypothetical protein